MKAKVITAIITPFQKDNVYKIDYESFIKVLTFVIDNGSDGILIAGTTGEGSTVTLDERIKLLEVASDVVKKSYNNSIELFIGIGNNNTYDTISSIKKLNKYNDKISGLLIVAPYYSLPNSDGIYKHFEEISKISEIDIILYDIPSRTNIYFNSELMIRLSSLSKIVAVKSSSNNFPLAAEMIYNTSLKYYAGNDDVILPYLSIGAEGVISVISHIYGLHIKRLIDVYSSGKDQELLMRLNTILINEAKSIFCRQASISMKTLLFKKGIIASSSVRLPLSA